MLCVSVELIIQGRGRLLPPVPCGEAVIHQPAMLHNSHRHFQEPAGCPCLPWAQEMQPEWDRYRTWKSCHWAWWRGTGGSAGWGRAGWRKMASSAGQWGHDRGEWVVRLDGGAWRRGMDCSVGLGRRELISHFNSKSMRNNLMFYVT